METAKSKTVETVSTAPSLRPERSTKFRQYANIVRELAIVDFRKKYHDSSLGYLWSMLNPLLIFAVYHFVFSYLFTTHLHKFTLYLLTGIFFWNFFQDATASAMNAVRAKARLAQKIYFPRILIVLASSMTAFLSFMINTLLIVVIVVLFDHAAPFQLLTIVPFVLLALLATGVGFILAILFVHFGDILQIWMVSLSLGFWLTPITYDPRYVPGPMTLISQLNPVGRILIMLRAFLVYDNSPAWTFNVTTILFCIGVFLFGWWLFEKYEHRVAEYF